MMEDLNRLDGIFIRIFDELDFFFVKCLFNIDE